MSGHDIARDADVLLHDGQYRDHEYADHVGWGHSSIGDAMDFANKADVEQLVLFHHDPYHTDVELEALLDEARGTLARYGRPRLPRLRRHDLRGVIPARHLARVVSFRQVSRSRSSAGRPTCVTVSTSAASARSARDRATLVRARRERVELEVAPSRCGA